jgi:hypothetical protein
MPVLESTDHIIPRSVLQHRPISDDTNKAGKKTTATSTFTPVAQRASRLRQKQTEENAPEKDDDNEEVKEWKQAAPEVSETKRVRASSSQPATATGPKKLPKTPLPASPSKKATSPRKRFSPRSHPVLLLGIGMIIMLVLWTLLTFVASWWNTTWDDIHYGRPRTFQTDMVVGHNDSASNPSHFIALNLNGRIEVIEFPGGDASKSRIYIGPQLFGSGQELIPVILSFVDVKSNHQPDMIIRFQDTRIVYINENGGFRPARPDELQAVQQYLQKHGQ